MGFFDWDLFQDKNLNLWESLGLAQKSKNFLFFYFTLTSWRKTLIFSVIRNLQPPLRKVQCSALPQ